MQDDYKYGTTLELTTFSYFNKNNIKQLATATSLDRFQKEYEKEMLKILVLIAMISSGLSSNKPSS